MLFFLFIILIICILLIFYKRYSHRQCLFIFLLIIVSFITAFQDNYGPDYKGYIKIYNMQLIPKRFGFLSSNIVLILHKLELPPQSFFVCFGIILGLMLFYTISLLRKDEIIVSKVIYLVLLIVTGRFYLETFNTIRSTVASLFFIASFFDLKKSNLSKIRKILFYSLGIGIHPSLALLCPFFIVKKIFFKKINAKIWFVILIICFGLKEMQIVKIVAKFIYDHFPGFLYRNYLISKYLYTGVKGTNIIASLNFLMLLLTLKYYKNESNSNRVFILNLLYLSFSIQYIMFGSMIFDRMISLFAFIFPYIYYYLNEKIKTRSNEILIVKLSILGTYLLIFIKSFY